ncbi:MAG: YihY/virulence factor BrkB family protein, partial [Rikenellaceae bacterium]|nr:YihY/virulence factor BrkB family protein [Rikenellaceae bacterium]
MIKRIIRFLTEDFFHLREEEVENRFLRWSLRQYKLLYYTARGVVEHDTLTRSASLTFYTLMAIVPLAAIIFAVMKGFGMAENLTRELHAALPQFPEFINYIVGFANNALARTRGGLLATLSVMMLFWAVMRVFASIEAAFNNIWEVKRSRGFARQFSDYIAVVVIVPVLWISSSAVIHNLHEWFGINDSTFYHIWTNVVSVVLIWGMFTFVYIVLPNTKVRFISALTASLVSGTTFLLFQWAYVALQSSMSAYNAIYGSFAALPLFLIWLQTSWQIVLFGGELAFAYQNIKKFEQERESLHISHENRRKVMLATMLVITRSFTSEQGPLSSEQISQRL